MREAVGASATHGIGAWAARVKMALSDIKIAHSVFALPFALLGAFMAATAPGEDVMGWGRLGGLLALVVVCMVLARTWAMLVNRLADRRFDRENPRTAGRAFASGKIEAREGWIIALGSAGAFVLCCGGFWWLDGNPWPAMLALPVLGWIALYSYTKRFTALCHLFLGGALAASPIAASIAVRPGVWAEFFDGSGGGEWGVGASIGMLAGFVLFWVGGFDIAYAMQDIEADRALGLRSVPARLGAPGSAWVARGLHLCAWVCLALAWRWGPGFGGMMLAGVIAVGGVLALEHVVLARRGLAGLPLAFFTLNGVVSVLLGALGIADTLL